jgi:hypothetical protein
MSERRVPARRARGRDQPGIWPAVDGAKGAPSVFDSAEAGRPAPVKSMTLESSQTLEGGAVWLRYRLHNR